MIAIVKSVLGWLTGGFLDRAMSSVDKYVESTTDKEKIKAAVVLRIGSFAVLRV